MAMQFEYDENEGTFYYFLISFYALCLIPLTYYFWPKHDPKETSEQIKRKCHCEPCQMKRLTLKANSPWKARRRKIVKLMFLMLWVGFIFSAFKVSQIEMEWTEFDPFAELGIDRDATPVVIRKAYRQLSLRLHPDKGGDPKKFIRIAKAFAALTNEESRKNWQEYGNPDGPGVAHFGIALPKWIVDKKNSFLVLGFYALVIMIILPVSVGYWWYNSIKFQDNVLRATNKIYWHFLSRSSTITVKRIIMILAASLEFERNYNSEIIERPSDNQEVSTLVRQLPHVHINIHEKPFCAIYATKARALLHAQLSRLPLPPYTLQLDKQIILKKCPALINEMISVISEIHQAVSYQKASRSYMPRIDTLENIMHVSSMVVQALWNNQSPILQLPHIREDMLKHFVTKRRSVRTILQLAEMPEEDRRALLRSLTDDQYRDVMNVLAGFPYVQMECTTGVVDEEDTTITANSIVTVTVRLVRRSLGQKYPALLTCVQSPSSNNTMGTTTNSKVNGRNFTDPSITTYSSNRPLASVPHSPTGESEMKMGGGDDISLAGNEESNCPSGKGKQPAVWEKNRSKKKSSKSKGSGKAKKVVQPTKVSKKKQKKTDGSNDNPDGTTTPKEKNDESDQEKETNKMVPIKSAEVVDGGFEGENSDSDSVENNEETETNNKEKQSMDDDWSHFHQQNLKENSLETKTKTTHTVHCPYFPLEKLEAWWIYIADKKSKLIITPPKHICSLQAEEEVHLKFYPNPKPGQYVYTVRLLSDSYMDMDILQTIKINVSEAKVVTDHPQWQISDDEDNQSNNASSHEDGSVAGSNDSGTDYDYED